MVVGEKRAASQEVLNEIISDKKMYFKINMSSNLQGWFGII
jgi:hypothetical protein